MATVTRKPPQAAERLIAEALRQQTAFFNAARRPSEEFLRLAVESPGGGFDPLEVEKIRGLQLAYQDRFQKASAARLRTGLRDAMRKPTRLTIVRDLRARQREATDADARARFQQQIEMARAGPDERRDAVAKLLETERRYALAHATALAGRARGASRAAQVRTESPTGAYWFRNPESDSCERCLAMDGKLWPWEVLDRFSPPVHPNCRCQLVPVGAARANGLVGARTQVPSAATAIHRARRVLQETVSGAILVEAVRRGLFRETGVERDWMGRFAPEHGALGAPTVGSPVRSREPHGPRRSGGIGRHPLVDRPMHTAHPTAPNRPYVPGGPVAIGDQPTEIPAAWPEQGLAWQRRWDALPAHTPVWLFHGTDKASIPVFVEHGVDPANKPGNLARTRYERGEDAVFAPGRGLGGGLYVGKDPWSVGGYGGGMIAVRVRKSQVAVTPEQAALGETEPGGGLRVNDAMVTGPIHPADVQVIELGGMVPNRKTLDQLRSAPSLYGASPERVAEFGNALRTMDRWTRADVEAGRVPGVEMAGLASGVAGRANMAEGTISLSPSSFGPDGLVSSTHFAHEVGHFLTLQVLKDGKIPPELEAMAAGRGRAEGRYGQISGNNSRLFGRDGKLPEEYIADSYSDIVHGQADEFEYIVGIHGPDDPGEREVERKRFDEKPETIWLRYLAQIAERSGLPAKGLWRFRRDDDGQYRIVPRLQEDWTLSRAALAAKAERQKRDRKGRWKTEGLHPGVGRRSQGWLDRDMANLRADVANVDNPPTVEEFKTIGRKLDKVAKRFSQRHAMEARMEVIDKRRNHLFEKGYKAGEADKWTQSFNEIQEYLSPEEALEDRALRDEYFMLGRKLQGADVHGYLGVLRELRPMGGEIRTGDVKIQAHEFGHDELTGLTGDLREAMDEISEVIPSAWIEAMNRRGKVNFNLSTERAQHQVVETPDPDMDPQAREVQNLIDLNYKFEGYMDLKGQVADLRGDASGARLRSIDERVPVLLSPGNRRIVVTSWGQTPGGVVTPEGWPIELGDLPVEPGQAPGDPAQALRVDELISYAGFEFAGWLNVPGEGRLPIVRDTRQDRLYGVRPFKRPGDNVLDVGYFTDPDKGPGRLLGELEHLLEPGEPPEGPKTVHDSLIRINPRQRGTLLHEVGHRIEKLVGERPGAQRPSLLQALLLFTGDRRKGEDYEKLSVLTGDPGYEDHERSFADDWQDAYIGKNYMGRSSEVLTMGLQMLFYPNLDNRLERDDDMRHFILGLLAAAP